MDIHPTELKMSGESELQIAWSDGEVRKYRLSDLRDQCPCASCREKRRSEPAQAANPFPILTRQEAQPLRITAMKPVGQYAYHIAWSDGHDTGIYTFEHLRSLGQQCQG